MKELQGLQDWYTSQCNEDWEHSFGVKIETLDNPGWTLEVDLRETELSGKEFSAISRGDSEDDADWIHCKVESEKFFGSGGAGNLAELLQQFLTWAGR
ncbi:immunity 53 family protein [Luteimonas sp. A482]